MAFVYGCPHNELWDALGCSREATRAVLELSMDGVARVTETRLIRVEHEGQIVKALQKHHSVLYEVEKPEVIE